MSGVGTGIAIAAGVGAAGSIAGGAISAHAAGKAADAQSKAAMSAADLQHQDAQASLKFQEDQWKKQQENLAPWLSAGKDSLGTLASMLNTPGAGLLTPWSEKFTAPTMADAANEPGYKFAEQQGEGALLNSAAAKGSLLSGNTLAALTKYGQDAAQSNYQNVYNRAMQEYNQRYGIFENNQTNTFNRLAALSGVGQTAATTLGTEGSQAANNVANINLTSGAQIGQDINNAGAATASGYVGAGNAWGGALSGASNNLMQLYMLKNMFPSTSKGYPGVT